MSTVNGWLTTPGQQALLHNDIHDHLTISGVFKRNYNWRVASKLWIYIDRIYRSWHHPGTSGKENPATELNNIEKIMRIRNQPKSTSAKILYQCRYQVNLLWKKKMTIWGNVYYPWNHTQQGMQITWGHWKEISAECSCPIADGVNLRGISNKPADGKRICLVLSNSKLKLAGFEQWGTRTSDSSVGLWRRIIW